MNKIWRNLINKPKLSIHVSSPGEVGYTHYGPTFAVAGTLFAVGSVVLIQNMCVEIKGLSEKSYSYMEWFAFRPTTNKMGEFSELQLTMTSKFTISPQNSFDFNIIFADTNRYSEMKPLSKAVKDTWEEALLSASQSGQAVNHNELFQEFLKLKVIADAVERLKSINIWKPGAYSLKTRIITESPKQVFDTQNNFTITETDAQKLAGNASLIIASLCQANKAPYFYSIPELSANHS